ncbi:hypothetical protein [Luteolibacter sp. Populi]|uniref:hypothetical protein n=1 Tax=Luteolibacter sp. Populi TaxID=3230487 RepID=UPI0034674B8A
MSSPTNLPDLELASALFQNLDPRQALPATDPRYVDLYHQRIAADPKRKLINTLLLSGKESLQFFSGFRGSGKSTELLRLKHQLHHEHGYNVFYADAAQYIGPNEPLDVSLLRIAIIGSLCVELDRKLGVKDPGASFFKRIGDWISKFRITPETIGMEVPAGPLTLSADFKTSFTSNPDFRADLRKFLANRRAALDEQIKEFLVGLRTQLEKLVDHKKDIVLIFDQLEQDPGALISTTDRSEIINSAKQLFQNQRDLLKLPGVHLILTVPSWLKIVLKGVPIVFVPNFPLWKRDEDRTERTDEMNLMRELVLKRFTLTEGSHAGDQLAAFFAPDIQQGIDRLIRQSGGFIRDLLRLLQIIVRESVSAGPAGDETLTIAIDELRQSYLPLVAKDAEALLRMMTLREVGISDSTDEEIARLANLMNTQMAFFFLNGDDWFDVHPLLREEVQAIHDREYPSRPAKPAAKKPRSKNS